jgi:hypothetical protein
VPVLVTGEGLSTYTTTRRVCTFDYSGWKALQSLRLEALEKHADAVRVIHAIDGQHGVTIIADFCWLPDNAKSP